MHKSILIAAFTLCGLFSGLSNAEALESYPQFDILINLPRAVGVGGLEQEYQNLKAVNEFLETYPMTIPDLRGHYFLESGSLRFGLGARGLSAIFETLFWPTLTAEYDLGRVRFTGSVGGGLFFLFGVVNSIETESIWLPEATVAYKFNDWFHLGLSGTGVYVPTETSDIMGFVWGIFARFSLGGPEG